MKKFKKVYVEITNVCNLSCDFCPKTNRSPQFMRVEAFENILIKLKGSTDYLYFHVMGEPLLHPLLGLFLDLSHKYGYKVNLTTNGTKIDMVADSIVLKPALRQVNFSLHSFNANGKNDPMKGYTSKIFKFIKNSKRTSELLISLRLWNLNEAGLNEGNCCILQQIEKEFSLDNKIIDILKTCNAIQLDEGVFLNQAVVFDWPDTTLKEISKSGFCHGLRDQVAILVDGTVVPCCLDGEGIIKLGDINNQEFDEIIQGHRARLFYDGFSARHVVEPLCRRCGYRKRFDA